MMTHGFKSKGNAKKYGEVFTPPQIVLEMILQDGIRDCLVDVNKTMFDPAVGEGQFPTCELVWKMFFSVERLDEETALRALASLYGVDIQSTSVAKCKEHLLETICAAYKFFTGQEFTRMEEAREILDQNIIVGNSLELMRDWANCQQSLF